MSQLPNGGSQTHLFYHSDGSGNITALIDGSQQVVAQYQYDPFGNLLAQSGSQADANRYRFSSKERDPVSGLALFEYRAYDSKLQRWINRDPIGEAGGMNVFAFARNDGVSRVDPLGLDFRLVSNPTLLGGQAPQGPFYYVLGDTPLEQVTANLFDIPSLVGNTVAEALHTGGEIAEGAANGIQQFESQFLGGPDVLMAFPAGGILDETVGALKSFGRARCLLGVRRAPSPTALARTLGKAGEDAAGISKNTERIPSLTGTADFRVPDALSHEEGIIGEVKNVERLSFTAQLKDYVAYAQQNGYEFQLTIRSDTYLSTSLRNAVADGTVVLKKLK